MNKINFKTGLALMGFILVSGLGIYAGRASAAIEPWITLNGVVGDFNQEKVSIQTRNKTVWEIPRASLPKNFVPVPGKKVSVKVSSQFLIQKLRNKKQGTKNNEKL